MYGCLCLFLARLAAHRQRGIPPRQSGSKVIAWEHCTESPLCDESSGDLVLYGSITFLLLRITLTRGCVVPRHFLSLPEVLPSVSTVRYTVHLTGSPARKRHLRTLLSTMGFTEILITEKPVEATDPKPAKDNCPTQPESQMVATLFKRRLDTPWTDAEVVAYQQAKRTGLLTIENLQKLTEFYRRERSNPENHCRTSILTFCKYFASEVDKMNARPVASRKNEWPQNVVKLPVQSEEEVERVRLAALEQARLFRESQR